MSRRSSSRLLSGSGLLGGGGSGLLGGRGGLLGGGRGSLLRGGGSSLLGRARRLLGRGGGSLLGWGRLLGHAGGGLLGRGGGGFLWRHVGWSDSLDGWRAGGSNDTLCEKIMRRCSRREAVVWTRRRFSSERDNARGASLAFCSRGETATTARDCGLSALDLFARARIMCNS